MRKALFLVPALALAACGGSEVSNNSTAATPGAPVANATPPAGQQWSDVVSATPEGGFVMGNPNAQIRLVEYGSRSCPVCGAFANTGVEPLKEKYVNTGRVSFEFRDFLIHPQDMGIALLGHCVEPAAFFPVLERMFAEQATFNQRAATLSPATLAALQGMSPAQAAPALARELGYVDLIKQLGVPETKANQCLNDQAKFQRLGEITQNGANNGVNGTPTFFINGEKVENVVNWTQLEEALKRAGA